MRHYAARSTAAMANGAYVSLVATNGGGGWYLASVYDQIVPRRDRRAGSNSVPSQSGLRQAIDAAGKNTVPHVVHRFPSSEGSPSSTNHPSAPSAGTRVLVMAANVNRSRRGGDIEVRRLLAPAVHHEIGSGDVRRERRREVEARIGDLARFGEAPEWHGRAHRRDRIVVAVMKVRLLGAHHPGRDC